MRGTLLCVATWEIRDRVSLDAVNNPSYGSRFRNQWKPSTAMCRYNAAQNSIHKKDSISEVSLVRIWEIIDRVLKAPHYNLVTRWVVMGKYVWCRTIKKCQRRIGSCKILTRSSLLYQGKEVTRINYERDGKCGNLGQWKLWNSPFCAQNIP